MHRATCHAIILPLSLSLSFSSSYIFTPSLLFFLHLSNSLFLSNVSLVHFATDVSRSIDFSLNWLFNIAACSNRVRTQLSMPISRSLYTRNLTEYGLLCVRIDDSTVRVRCLPLRDTCTCSCTNTTNGYTTNCSSGVLCKACKEIPNGIRELN